MQGPDVVARRSIQTPMQVCEGARIPPAVCLDGNMSACTVRVKKKNKEY